MPGRRPHEDDNEVLMVPVLSPIVPWNAHKFALHVLLSLGDYDTEIGMMSQSDGRPRFEDQR